ncbi:MAG TPA: hypothetical protein PKC21_02515 [Oligoflexia bacterium]|nr:hypothetical protein [Oligoflexia bacterium]HMR24204.1 hypothetical protein [Oligoflexia bacterium]
MHQFTFFAPLVIYFLILFSGFFFLKRTKNISDKSYFLADRSIGLLPSVLSVVATETSVATILIFPAVGMSSGYQLAWLGIGYIIGRWLVAYFYLQKLYEPHKLSIYQTICGDNVSAKKVLSGAYLLAKFVSSGVRFFMAGYALNQLFDIPVSTCLLIITLIVGLYSLLGGLQAVVFTDQIQAYIILLMGVFLCFHFIQSYSIENWLVGSSWINTQANHSNAMYFISLLIGGMIIPIGSHGADQDLNQRVLAVKSLSAAKKAMVLSGVGATVVIVLYLTVGILLKQAQINGLDAKSPLVSYMMTINNPLFLGCFAVLVFAAAMSTLDSAINSTGAIWKSVFASNLSGKYWSFLSLVCLFAFALLFIQINKHAKDFLSLAMGSMNYINGGLIGVLSLYVFLKRPVSTTMIIAALLGGFLSTVFANFYIKPALAWSWTIVLSSSLAFALGFLFAKKT